MSDVPDVLDTLLALQEVSENALAAAANSQQATKRSQSLILLLNYYTQ